MSMRWIATSPLLLVLYIAVGVGCSSSFEAERHQAPLYQLDEKSDVALVRIDVPTWLDEESVQQHPPEPIIRQTLARAFEDTNLNIVDRTGMGVDIDIYANTEPLIFDTATFVATVGHPYRYDATHGAQAYGIRPMTWEALEAPPGFEIDSDTGEVYWVPDEPGNETVVLKARNELGSDTYRFDIDVREDETYPDRRSRRPPEISTIQRFAAQGPGEVSTSVPEPLILAVHVHRWDEELVEDGSSKDYATMTPTKVRQYNTDIVYSLWTRDGKEVDTRRVRRSARLGTGYGELIVSPPFPRWYSDEWILARETRPQPAENDPAKMFYYTALANAKALAYPFFSRTVSHSVTLQEDVGMERGFELMDEGDWAGAREQFQRIADEEAHRIGEMTSYESKERQRKATALANKGLTAEFQGRDDEAVEFFNRALAVSGGRASIHAHRDRALLRLEDYVDLSTKVNAANEAFHQQKEASSSEEKKQE